MVDEVEDEVPELSEEEAQEYRHEELMKAIAKMTLAISNSKGDAQIRDLISNNVEVLGSVAAQMGALAKSKQDINVAVNQDAVVKAVNEMSNCISKCISDMTKIIVAAEEKEEKQKREYEFIISRDTNGKFSKIIAKQK